MFKVLGNLPKDCYVACSGGPDSMFAVDFLLRGRRKVHLLYYNHGTEHGQEAEEFISSYHAEHTMVESLTIGRNNDESKLDGESDEMYWRRIRYKFFGQFDDKLLITAHTLDDQVENWIFTALRGSPRLIPYQNGNIIRPFLLTKKREILEWNNKKLVPYVEDQSNHSNKYMRSFIRNNMVKDALVVNPGLYKTIARKVSKEYEELSR